MKLNKRETKLLDKLWRSEYSDINFALWPSSWGRLQCNALSIEGKVLHSWAGRADQELNTEMIIEALLLIAEQIKE